MVELELFKNDIYSDGFLKAGLAYLFDWHRDIPPVDKELKKKQKQDKKLLKKNNKNEKKSQKQSSKNQKKANKQEKKSLRKSKKKNK